MRAEGAGFVEYGIHRDPTLSTVRRILIVGAGGFGREVLLWAKDGLRGEADKIRGFLSADLGEVNELPILGNPATFEPCDGDAFLLAIGIPFVRRRVAERLLEAKARFLQLIHPSAIVAPSASIGLGAIICPHAIVSDSATVGRFGLLNYYSSLGHDADCGDYAVLSPYATLGGYARIGDDVFLGMHASVGPGKCIGARSKVSANSCALADVPSDSIVFGVPGRVARLVSPSAGTDGVRSS